MNQYPGPVYPGPTPRRQDSHYVAAGHPHYIPYFAPSSPHPGHIPYGPPPQYIQPWYPYQQYPYPAPPQPRHYPQQSPLVVSSPLYHPNRQYHHQPPHPPPPPPPTARTPLPDQSTPSTTSQTVASPSTTPITTSDTTATPPIQPIKASPELTGAVEPQPRKPFSLPLPWYSVPESSFPPRPARRRRKKKSQELLSDTPRLPSFPRQRPISYAISDVEVTEVESKVTPFQSSKTPSTITTTSPEQANEETSQSLETLQPSKASDAATTTFQRKRAPTRPVIPAIPNLQRRPGNNVLSPPQSHNQQPSIDSVQQSFEVNSRQRQDSADAESTKANETENAPSKKAAPKSWAELLRSKNSMTSTPAAIPPPLGNSTSDSNASVSQSNSLPDALRTYDVGNTEKFSFLEPRGLVNTGNMCYMNSILQVLLFCVPFFELLDQIRKRAVHNFKSNTPLLDAMIMFMNEYNVIDSASTVDQLRLRLKENELEQFGEPFIPEYVYDAIKHIPRFSSMRRGQQQDAEEFLGLLLEVLHLECISVMDKIGDTPVSTESQANGTSQSSALHGQAPTSDGSDGWMEVSRHQKPAITRSSGASTITPITKIFGGSLRSEFRVPGSKNSVTLTPYQQLQLDINDSGVTNITHALQGLAKSEKIEGQFATPRGYASHGVKQVFIEDLPPMLILHLKRFEYDSKLGSTQKIWKKVGYPLDLEIPKEVFSPGKRINYTSRPQGLPKYRLSAVVYHHGKYAGGGHYTVDVRRQDRREWIRLDDTVIRREVADIVASEGGEEDPAILAAALDQHKKEQRSGAAGKSTHPYTIGEDTNYEHAADGDGVDAEGWSQVNSNGIASPPSSSASNRKWSGIVTNGTSNTHSGGSTTPTGKQTPRESKGAAVNGRSTQQNSKDKVAYILFYEHVHG